MLRTYARVAGLVLILFGVVGIFGVLGDFVGPVEGVLYLGTGGIFFYTGLGRMNAGDTRGVVGRMSVLYLVAGVFVIFLSAAYDLPLLGAYDLVDDYARVAFGALNILATLLPCQDDPPATS